jgi:hypothetical protein
MGRPVHPGLRRHRPVGPPQRRHGPDSVTRAIKRISNRAGAPINWTGHSLRIGLASTSCTKKADSVAVAVADQGG